MASLASFGPHQHDQPIIEQPERFLATSQWLAANKKLLVEILGYYDPRGDIDSIPPPCASLSILVLDNKRPA